MFCLCVGHRPDKLFLICSLYFIESLSLNIHTICYSLNAYLLVAYLVRFRPVIRHVAVVNVSIDPLIDEFQTIGWFVLCEYAFTIHATLYGEHREL